LLRRRGRLIMVYHPSRLPELCAQLEAAHLRLHRMRLVHASQQAPASIVLVEAMRDGRDALTVLPPLWVYQASGDYTKQSQSISRGGPPLNEAAPRRRRRGERGAERPSADAVPERRAVGDTP